MPWSTLGLVGQIFPRSYDDASKGQNIGGKQSFHMALRVVQWADGWALGCGAISFKHCA